MWEKPPWEKPPLPGSVPYDDAEKYRRWRQGKRQWVRRGNQAAYDRSGATCRNSTGCGCPGCEEFGEMRLRAHSNHYLKKMEWAEAWREAGWQGDGNAETPFCNPGESVDGGRSKIVAGSDPRSDRSWMADRFAELFTTPDESTCNEPIAIPSFLSLKPEIP